MKSKIFFLAVSALIFRQCASQKKSENLKDGFIWKKLSSEEKQKLKEIISKF